MRNWMIAILLLLMVSPILAFNAPTPYASGGGFLSSLHIGARVQQICVFNTSMVIIFVMVVGLSVYAGAKKLSMQLIGIIILMAAVQMFCQNQIITFIVIALMVVKPMMHKMG